MWYPPPYSTREAPGDDGGLHQRPLPALLTAYPFLPAQITTTCTMRPLGKAAVASGKAADGTRPGVHCAAFGRVVGDAAPGRPTRLDSHPGGVRLGQTPGGNGCTAYSAFLLSSSFSQLAHVFRQTAIHRPRKKSSRPPLSTTPYLSLTGVAWNVRRVLTRTPSRRDFESKRTSKTDSTVPGVPARADQIIQNRGGGRHLA